MKNLILSIHHNDIIFDPIRNICIPRIENYAKKIGAEFILLHDTGKHKDKYYMKYDIVEIFKTGKYGRCMIIDTDVAIKKSAPDIFEFVPPEYIGVKETSDKKVHESYIVFPTAIKTYNKAVSGKENFPVKLESWNKKYYNAGVIVCSYFHTDAFNCETGEISTYCAEQGVMNYNFMRFNLSIMDFGYKFNCFVNRKPFTEKFYDSYFIHGVGLKNNFPQKIQNMKDIEKELKKLNE